MASSPRQDFSCAVLPRREPPTTAAGIIIIRGCSSQQRPPSLPNLREKRTSVALSSGRHFYRETCHILIGCSLICQSLFIVRNQRAQVTDLERMRIINNECQKGSRLNFGRFLCPLVHSWFMHTQRAQVVTGLERRLRLMNSNDAPQKGNNRSNSSGSLSQSVTAVGSIASTPNQRLSHTTDGVITLNCFCVCV